MKPRNTIKKKNNNKILLYKAILIIKKQMVDNLPILKKCFYMR